MIRGGEILTNASLYSLWRIFIQHPNMCGVGFRTGSVKSGVPQSDQGVLDRGYAGS
jgi:hypothetical protein